MLMHIVKLPQQFLLDFVYLYLVQHQWLGRGVDWRPLQGNRPLTAKLAEALTVHHRRRNILRCKVRRRLSLRQSQTFQAWFFCHTKFNFRRLMFRHDIQSVIRIRLVIWVRDFLLLNFDPLFETNLSFFVELLDPLHLFENFGVGDDTFLDSQKALIGITAIHKTQLLDFLHGFMNFYILFHFFGR